MNIEAAHMALIMERMTEIMSIQHLFDDRMDRPDGGPLKYVLEVGADRFAAFLSDRTGDMIVSPLGMIDFMDEDDIEEPTPVLRFGCLAHPVRTRAELGPAYW